MFVGSVFSNDIHIFDHVRLFFMLNHIYVYLKIKCVIAVFGEILWPCCLACHLKFFTFFLHSTDSFHWKLAVSFLHVLFHWNLDWALFSTLYIVLYFTFVSYMLASILFMSYYFIFIVFSLILQNCFQISYFTMFVFVFQYKFCHFSQFSRKQFTTT